ncbi:hypothetical protein Tco_1053807 [Tanacetum coccineum]|uniref:Uncharacterized protein n=1 Tax=Tanacetum coccineum TaxID=301880 RepID=A0ABQ5GVM3_9ASTR
MAEIGCSRARIGPSKSSQSLSIAQMGRLSLIEGHLVFTVFHHITIGLSRPIRWVEIAPITIATASTNVNGEVELTASIDGQDKTITEASLRRHLKLEDNVNYFIQSSTTGALKRLLKSSLAAT